MIKKKFLFTTLTILVIWGCKKNFDATPTYAEPSIAGSWAKSQPYYSPSPQIYIDSLNIWKSFISFAFTTAADPDKIGFANPYVPGKGTDALYFNTIYKSQNLTSDSGYYNITIPKCFQLIPKSKDSLTTGTVLVIAQSVTVYRKDKSSFTINIGPSSNPGTYNTITGIMQVEVMFDETSIGGAKGIIRKYKFTS